MSGVFGAGRPAILRSELLTSCSRLLTSCSIRSILRNKISTVEFLISNFRRVLNLVYFLLGISPASEWVVADVSEPSVRSHLQRLTQKKVYKIHCRSFPSFLELEFSEPLSAQTPNSRPVYAMPDESNWRSSPCCHESNFNIIILRTYRLSRNVQSRRRWHVAICLCP
jgi:hypothetical protein